MTTFTNLLNAIEEYADTREQRKEDLSLHITHMNDLEIALRKYVDERVEKVLSHFKGAR